MRWQTFDVQANIFSMDNIYTERHQKNRRIKDDEKGKLLAKSLAHFCTIGIIEMEYDANSC